MPRFLQQSGAALNIIVALIALASVLAVAAMSIPHRPQPQGPSVREVQILLAQLGLNPSVLAAAGASAQQTAAVVAAAHDHLAGPGSGISAARASCASLARQVNTLAGLASSGRASQEQLAQLASLRSDLAAANATLDSALAQALAAATAGLSPAQLAVFNTIKANAHRELPIHFKATQRSDADWIALRDALVQARVDHDAGNDASQAASTLQAALSDPPVANALANINTHASDLNNAWIIALGN